MAVQEFASRQQCCRVTLNHETEVEEIARGRTITSMPHFLRYDFCSRLHFHRALEQGPLIVSGVGQIQRNNEVDLAFRQKQLHELRMLLILSRDVLKQRR